MESFQAQPYSLVERHRTLAKMAWMVVVVGGGVGGVVVVVVGEEKGIGERE